jgi:glycosyltransferase involved in cell wall biosynthesis
MDIWRKVLDKRPDARLAMIGDGPLDQDLRAMIKTHGMECNVEVLGFLDGEQKFEVFRQSRLVVHPATYDSGGMAAAEAMAWGLPGVSFDLEALKTYYPKGMIKTSPGDNRQFAENILSLLGDPDLYKKTAAEAHQLIVDDWDWRKRADLIFRQVFSEGGAGRVHEENGI